MIKWCPSYKQVGLTQREAAGNDAGGQNMAWMIIGEVLLKKEEGRVDNEHHSRSAHQAVEEEEQRHVAHHCRQGHGHGGDEDPNQDGALCSKAEVDRSGQWRCQHGQGYRQ